MIPMYIHLGSMDKALHDKIFLVVSFPFVPRINESIILSDSQKSHLLTLLHSNEVLYHISNNGNVQYWDDVIDDMGIVNEVAYDSSDGSIHITINNE